VQASRPELHCVNGGIYIWANNPFYINKFLCVARNPAIDLQNAIMMSFFVPNHGGVFAILTLVVESET